MNQHQLEIDFAHTGRPQSLVRRPRPALPTLPPGLPDPAAAVSDVAVRGRPADATPAIPISPDSVQRIVDIMKNQYSFDVGTPGSVNIDNPLRNLFGRIDYQISPAHRLVVWEVYNHAENGSFSRNLTAFRTSPSTQDAGFRLGSNMFTSVNTNTSTVLQFFSNFVNGRSNEFLAGYNHIADVRSVVGRYAQPLERQLEDPRVGLVERHVGRADDVIEQRSQAQVREQVRQAAVPVRDHAHFASGVPQPLQRREDVGEGCPTRR